MYNELNNTRAACDQLSREKVKRKLKNEKFFVICFSVLILQAELNYTNKHDVHQKINKISYDKIKTIICYMCP